MAGRCGEALPQRAAAPGHRPGVGTETGQPGGAAALLEQDAFTVSRRGKSYRLKLLEWDKVARLESLGEGYGLGDLLAVLSGQKEHTPRKKATLQADPPKVNLLVDIQAKLQAGKVPDMRAGLRSLTSSRWRRR